MRQREDWPLSRHGLAAACTACGHVLLHNCKQAGGACANDASENKQTALFLSYAPSTTALLTCCCTAGAQRGCVGCAAPAALARPCDVHEKLGALFGWGGNVGAQNMFAQSCTAMCLSFLPMDSAKIQLDDAYLNGHARTFQFVSG